MRRSTSVRWSRAARGFAWALAFAGGSLLLVSSVSAAAAPTIALIAPATGPLAGGTAITITGTGFVAGATVDMGGAPAVGVTVVSATSITATTPPHPEGLVVVTVTNPDGQGATISNGFRFLGPPPTVTDVSPVSGPTTGGNTVTITGTQFASGATVTIDGRAAASVSVSSATTLTAVAPWGVAGAVADVIVTNADGQSATLAASYTYNQSAPPAVTAVSPTIGTAGGGTRVTITGSNFAAGATVRFGASLATNVTYQGPTTLIASAPAGTIGLTVAVTVLTADSQAGTLANAFKYTDEPSPTIKTVSPDAGPLIGGNAVTITGTNFRAGATVTFSSTAGTVLGLTTDSIIVAPPPKAAAGKVSVVVTNTDTKSATLTNAYNYQKGPAITTISPAIVSTSGGAEVTLAGTDFATGVIVSVGGQQITPASAAATSIVFSAPALAPGTYQVTVTNPDGQSYVSPEPLQYRAPAAVTSIGPSSGPAEGGTAVTIRGSGFVDGVIVKVGSLLATGVVGVDGTTITAVTPAGTGSKPVTVTLPDGVASDGAVLFTYVSSTGSFTAGSIPPQGIGLVVFSGGTNEALIDAALGAGCSSVTKLVVLAADGKGGFVTFLPRAPSVVNGDWNAKFPALIPDGTPLLVRCS